jgi:hypothetical protein
MMAGHYWSMDIPRAAGAAGTGILTGLSNSAIIPLLGLSGGLLIKILEPTNPQLRRGEYYTDGMVDGSAALLSKMIFSGR